MQEQVTSFWCSEGVNLILIIIIYDFHLSSLNCYMYKMQLNLWVIYYPHLTDEKTEVWRGYIIFIGYIVYIFKKALCSVIV